MHLRGGLSIVTLGILGAGTTMAFGGAVVTHLTNGSFQANEWTVSGINGAPARPSESESIFTPAGQTGGAVLYAEQGTNGFSPSQGFGNTLYLMYDWINSPAVVPGASASSSSFDVYFEIPKAGDDYAVHITNSGFVAFEKPHGQVSQENPDGTLKFMDLAQNPVFPWVPFGPSDPDFVQARFQGAVGFGPSPNSPANHLFAEFEVSIADPGNPAGGGLYSPDPAFWSAGGKHDTNDPPISSGIFTLNPDGTMFVLPVLSPNGGPIAQPSDLPEPTSMLAFAAGIGAMLSRARRRS